MRIIKVISLVYILYHLKMLTFFLFKENWKLTIEKQTTKQEYENEKIILPGRTFCSGMFWVGGFLQAEE